MRRFPRSVLASVVLAASLLVPMSAGPAANAANVYGAQLVVGNLSSVAAFAIAPDGRIFYAERLTGKVRIWDPVTQSSSLFTTLSNVSGSKYNELGLVGLVLDPSFDTNGFVYLYASRVESGVLRLQIWRYTDSAGTGTNPQMIFQNPTTAGGAHIGGKMTFGPDGKLYIVVGDRFDSSLAQQLNVPRGKVLRMNKDGSVPADNPIGPSSRVFSFGHRNGYGLAFDPQSGRLWETENGPECNDEINRIVPGGNFAWGPHETCSTPPKPPRNTNRDGPAPRILPRVYYKQTQGLTGDEFCQGCDLDTAAEGALFWGSFNFGTITRATLTADRLNIASKTIVYTAQRQVLSIETNPTNGQLYFSTGPGIYRLRPKA